MKIKAYFAHPMKLYGTRREENLIARIKDFCRTEGCDEVEIINPVQLQAEYEQWLEEKSKDEHAMRFFKPIVQGCDAVFFTGNTSGVVYECKKAQEVGIPTIDLESIN